MNWIAALVLASLSMVTRAQTIEYVHTDPLGSPVAITNQAGQVIERIQYEPFGTTLAAGNSDRPGYTGHVMDSLTLLTNMQQRYYDTAIGRFVSTDPVQANANSGASFNRYWYANNNPYRFMDPDGRRCATVNGKESCTFDEFKDKKGHVVTRDAALGGKASQLFGRGGRILKAEKAMTAKYTNARALAAKNGSVTIKGSIPLGIADKAISGEAIVNSMESTLVITNEGRSPSDTATIRHEGGVPATFDGTPSSGPMQFWSDGANVKAGTLFAHEIFHTIYSGVGERNRGWANTEYQLQHQTPFNDAANDL